MTKWEYEIIRTKNEGIIGVGKSAVTDHSVLNGKTIDDAFNLLGQEGWELVTASAPYNVLNQYTWYTFKRPRPE